MSSSRFDSGLEDGFKGMFNSKKQSRKATAGGLQTKPSPSRAASISATDPIISPSETRPREESKPVGSSVPLEQNTRPKPNEIIGKPENATPPLAPAPEPVPPAKRPKTRFVRREWPRPPYPPLGPLKFDPKAVGKRAGTGGLPFWGATLDDFYWYSVVVGVADWSTSSRMLAWVEGLCDKDDEKDEEGSEDGKGSREDRFDEGRDPESDEENMDTGSAEEGKNGKLIEEGRVEESAGRGKDEKTEDRRELQRKEMEVARAEIEFAKKEPEPMLLRPENVLKLVEEQDAKIRQGVYESGARREGELDTTVSSEEARADPFHPSRYPAPWPLPPFSHPTPFLQHRIPYHLLPQKLVVHDPDNVLEVRTTSTGPSATPSTSNSDEPRPDITHTYSLDLNYYVEKSVLAARESARKAWNLEHRHEPVFDGFYFTSDLKDLLDDDGDDGCAYQVVSSPIFVPLPDSVRGKQSSPSFEVPVAHLYLSGAQGRLKGKGHHSLVYEAEWELPRTLLQCISNPGRDSQFVPWETGLRREDICWPCVRDALKVRLDEINHSSTTPDESSSTSDDRAMRTITLHPSQWTSILSFPHSCSHPSASPPVFHPSTASVRITAKLSFENDRHLVREATNYQRFDESFFERWSGLQIVPPLKDPTPCGAVVPQFYGFYRPDVDETDDECERMDVEEGGRAGETEKKKKWYQSNILLLEDCGEPINVDELDIDDRQECAALVFRLHHNRWTHNSFYARNILVQHGDVSHSDHIEDPSIPSSNRRFRLIDFSRAIQYGDDGHALFKDPDREARAQQRRIEREKKLQAKRAIVSAGYKWFDVYGGHGYGHRVEYDRDHSREDRDTWAVDRKNEVKYAKRELKVPEFVVGRTRG